MIRGIGIDIIENARIHRIFARFGYLFAKKILSSNELKEFSNAQNKPNFLAKRFASKEAFSKALGTGVAKGIKFKEINILNEKNGKPYIKLLGKTKQIAYKKIKKKNYKISLSISDEKNYAVAFVTISA